MVERAVVDKIRDKRWRKLAISYLWILHMMRIGIHYTYFYSELRLWCNAKAYYLKASNQWLTGFMKMFKLSKNLITNKKVNNLEEV